MTSSARDDIARAMERARALREAGDDDHFYGPWKGGKKGSGGRPGGGKPVEAAAKRVGGQEAREAPMVSQRTDGAAESEAIILRREGATLGTEPNTGDVVDITPAMSRAGYDAWWDSAKDDFSAGALPGRSPFEKPFHSAGSKVVVYRGPDGKTAGFIHLGTNHGTTGVYMAHVDPGQRGKGIATKMYDWAQDHGVDMYGAVGQAGLFTPAGKAFTQAWLRHRQDVEG
jgi:ribosomal protein S18 acetylase RimI-like enzyme